MVYRSQQGSSSHNTTKNDDVVVVISENVSTLYTVCFRDKLPDSNRCHALVLLVALTLVYNIQSSLEAILLPPCCFGSLRKKLNH